MERNLTASMEDYLEIIYLLVKKNKLARAKDIAAHLGVKKPSVTGALRSLSKLGLVNYSPYGYIDLTDEGRRQASKILRRHEIIYKFLHKVLQVDEGKAEDDACKIEHAISDSTLERLVNFIHFIEHCPRIGEDCILSFRKFCQEGIKPQNCKICVKELTKKMSAKKISKTSESSV